MATSGKFQLAARAAIGVVLALAVVGPMSMPAVAQGAGAVSMVEDSPGHYAFSPGSVSVPVGTAVTWTDKSDAGHTVTSDTGAFGSSTINTNQTFSFTFNQAGTFAYHCTIHPYMHGTIVVTGAAQSTTASSSSAQPAAAATPAASPTPMAKAPSQLPTTGAGGTAIAGAGAALAGLLAATTGLVGALRRRR